MRVLIVDSSIQIIERLVDILSDAGNITDIHVALSCEEARRLFKENKHDAVLLDIDMPGNESFRLLKEIKKNGRKICVVILSNHIDKYVQEECKSLGADFLFDKFYDFEKIRMAIDSIGQLAPETRQKKNNKPQWTENDDEFRILVRTIKDYSIFTIDPEGFIQSWNEGARNIKGYESHEIVGKHISVFYTQEDIEKGIVEENLQSTRESGSFENEGWRVRKDGTKFWANVIFTAIYDDQQRLTGYAKVAKDITQREKTKENLVRLINDKTEELIKVFERITDAFVAFDTNWNFTYVNKKASEIIGRKPEELIGKNLREEFSEKKEYTFYKKFYESMEGQKTIQIEDYYPPLQMSFNAILYPSPEGLSVYLQDTSAKKKAETRLNESLEKYRQIVETAQEGIWMIDENNKTDFVNQKMCDILEYSEEEMMGKENFYFMDAEGKKQALKSIGRRRKGIVENMDLRYITKSGKQIWANISANPIFNEKGKYKGALAMVSDITEKVKLQRQLVDEQMNKQKEIAKAVINALEKERTEIGKELHDNINQMLTASNLFLSHSLSQDNYKPFIIKSKEITCDAIEEIRKLSKELVGPSKMESKGLINSIIDLIDDISIVKNIKINFNYSTFKEGEPDIDLKVVIYRIIQEQLNNIIKHSEASEAEIELKKRGNGLLLIIKDNGKGFDTSVKRKGIGLKNIEHRTEIYNGNVEIISSPGNGCKMEISFKQAK
jgi:PAS domain S-box-containing protein